MKKKKESKKTLITVLIIFGILIIFIPFTFLGLRFIKNKPVMGYYELEQGFGKTTLRIDLYTWEEGKEEDLKCDLWNCSGYKKGTYNIKGNKIIVRTDSIGYISYYYRILTLDNNEYLILMDKNDYKDIVAKYKKIK